MAFSAFTFIFCGGLEPFCELRTTNCLPKAPPIIILVGITLLVIGSIAQQQGDNLVMAQRFLFGGFFVLGVWWLLTNKFFKASEESLLTRILIHLGNISFSLYLIHYPFLPSMWHSMGKTVRKQTHQFLRSCCLLRTSHCCCKHLLRVYRKTLSFTSPKV